MIEEWKQILAQNRQRDYFLYSLLYGIAITGIFLVSMERREANAYERTVVADQVLRPPHPNVLDGFGMAVAGYHNMALVGTPNEVSNGNESGAAYVFDRKSGRLLHTLGLPRPTGGALFGQAVALHGRFAAVGAPHGRDDEGTYTGGVYVYDSSTGTSIRMIPNPNPMTGAFGHAIALDRTLLVIGDPQASTDDIYYAGAAYMFDVSKGERLLTLHPPHPVSGRPARFGHSVVVSDSMVFVGAPRELIKSVPAGVVYGFDRKTGVIRKTFVSPNSSESLFGWSLSVAGDSLLIGAFIHNGAFREEGIVYEFSIESGKVIRTLQNPNPHDGAHFGKSVGISSEYMIVGAPGDQVKETGMNRGAVYVFDRESGKLLETVINPSIPTGADDLFGAVLSVADEFVLVGCPFGGKDKDLDAGLVYDLNVNKLGVPDDPVPSTPSAH